jgi:hypothetical protein
VLTSKSLVPTWRSLPTITSNPTIPTKLVFDATGGLTPTWTCPTSITKARFRLWGGGGGGLNAAGYGGGSGAFSDGVYPVVAGGTYNISIGAGGLAGADGGDTTIEQSTLPGSYIATAKGGKSGTTGAGGVVMGVANVEEIAGSWGSVAGQGGNAPNGGHGSILTGIAAVVPGGGGYTAAVIGSTQGAAGRFIIEY